MTMSNILLPLPFYLFEPFHLSNGMKVAVNKIAYSALEKL
jgi:hypothetical protein